MRLPITVLSFQGRSYLCEKNLSALGCPPMQNTGIKSSDIRAMDQKCKVFFSAPEDDSCDAAEAQLAAIASKHLRSEI